MMDRRLPSGTSLYVAGQPAERMWFVKSGALVLSRESAETSGEGLIWAVRGPGSILGVEGLVRATYLDSARAVVDAVVCVASRELIEGWLGAREPAARALLECVLLTQGNDSPRRAGADGNAQQRVAAWVLGQEQATGPALPRKVTAELLGMLPETLSRALAAFAARGVLEVTRRSVTILDRSALEEAARGHTGPWI
jgi:CRP-like cAMP-binding protein